LRSQRDASRQASIASSVALASAARDVIADQPDVAALLSLAALRQEDRAEARNSMVLARESPRLQAAVGVLRHPADVNGTAFVRGGRSLVTTGEDGSVRLWDVASNRQRATFERPRAGRPVFTRPAVSRDGRVLAAGAENGTIALWDIASRKLLGTLPTRSHRRVSSVAFSPDGQTLASAGEEPRIRLWDVPGRSAAATLPRVDDLETFQIAFSPDGRTLASVGSSFVVRLWDVPRRVATGRRLELNHLPLTSLAYAADGRLFVGGDEVLIWDPGSAEPPKRIANDASAAEVAVSPDGRRLVVGVDGEIAVFAPGVRDAGRQAATAGPRNLASIELSPDGATIAAAGAGAKVWLYDATRLLRPAGETQADSDVAFERSGRTLATVGDGRIWLADARTGNSLGKPLTDRAKVERIALSPDGHTLASIGEGRDILLWDLRTRTVTGRLTGDGETVSSIAFSPDGRLLAAGGAEDKPAIVLWDVAKRSRDGRALPGHRGGVNSVAFSPGGDRLASAGADGEVGLWDLATRERIGRRVVRHEGAVRDVAFAADGATLVSAGDDGRIWLWESTGGPPRRAVAPSGDAVYSVAFASDGRMLVAGGIGGIRLWDVEAGRPLGNTIELSQAGAVAVSPDGTTFASADSDRTLRLWPGIIWPDKPALGREICRLTGSGLDDAERRRYADGIEFGSMCDG
jgi:WD40 repeat protein